MLNMKMAVNSTTYGGGKCHPPHREKIDSLDHMAVNLEREASRVERSPFEMG